MPLVCRWFHSAAGLILPTATLTFTGPLTSPPPTADRLAIASAQMTGTRSHLTHQCSPTHYPVRSSHHTPSTSTAGSTFHIATSLHFNSYFPLLRITMPIPSTFDKRSQYSGRAPQFFSFAAQSDLGLATHFEYCDVLLPC